MTDFDEHYLKKELYELLQKDSATFDFLQKASLDGLWYWDLESPEHEWMSPEFWMTLGEDPANKKHLADEWKDIIHPKDLQIAISNFEKHLEDPNHPYDQIVRYKHKNGSTVWVRCCGFAIRDEDGTPIRMLGAHNNITKLMEMEQRYKKNLAALDELYASTKLALEESDEIFNQAPDAIIQVDSHGYITKSNEEASKLFGYSSTELSELKVDELVPSRYRDTHAKHRTDYHDNPSIRPMGKFRKGIFATHKDGHEIPVEIRLSVINTRFGRHTLATIRDISEYKALIESLEQKVRENETLSWQVSRDSLTGMYNRRYFEEIGHREFSNFHRHQIPLAIMMVDIDHFKSVNDTYGHAIGDVVLKRVAQCISEWTRSGDTFARIGGEEFAVLLPMTSANACEVLAERLRYKVEESEEALDPGGPRVTISIGVAVLKEEDTSLEDLMNRADKALYLSKQRGRNCVSSCDEMDVAHTEEF